MASKVQELEEHMLCWFERYPSLPSSRDTFAGMAEKLEAMKVMAEAMEAENRRYQAENGGLASEMGSDEWKAMIAKLQSKLVSRFNG